MSRLALAPSQPIDLDAHGGRLLAAGSVALATLAALLAALVPVTFSIAVVFVCAGPHNWMEARYALARIPPRLGRLRPFFLLALVGIIGLTLSYAGLTAWLQCDTADNDASTLALAAWDSLVIGWIVLLIQLRSRQKPRRDWPAAIPLGFLALATAWLAPGLFGVCLVYIHPLMALVILDRELARRRPSWRRGYHACLTILPILVGLLWWQLAAAPDLPGRDAISVRIQQYAGAGLLLGVSSHALVATHTFLETVHYGIWLIAIPGIGLTTAPWKLSGIPMARGAGPARTLVASVLATGAIAVLTLWGGFLVDYPLTRDVYFTAALVHVLAEVPLLLRLV
jgi:hypothetical protein